MSINRADISIVITDDDGQINLRLIQGAHDVPETSIVLAREDMLYYSQICCRGAWQAEGRWVIGYAKDTPPDGYRIPYRPARSMCIDGGIIEHVLERKAERTEGVE